MHKSQGGFFQLKRMSEYRKLCDYVTLFYDLLSGILEDGCKLYWQEMNDDWEKINLKYYQLSQWKKLILQALPKQATWIPELDHKKAIQNDTNNGKHRRGWKHTFYSVCRIMKREENTPFEISIQNSESNVFNGTKFIMETKIKPVKYLLVITCKAETV